MRVIVITISEVDRSTYDHQTAETARELVNVLQKKVGQIDSRIDTFFMDENDLRILSAKEVLKECDFGRRILGSKTEIKKEKGLLAQIDEFFEETRERIGAEKIDNYFLSTIISHLIQNDLSSDFLRGGIDLCRKYKKIMHLDGTNAAFDIYYSTKNVKDRAIIWEMISKIACLYNLKS